MKFNTGTTKDDEARVRKALDVIFTGGSDAQTDAQAVDAVEIGANEAPNPTSRYHEAG